MAKKTKKSKKVNNGKGYINGRKVEDIVKDINAMIDSPEWEEEMSEEELLLEDADGGYFEDD